VPRLQGAEMRIVRSSVVLVSVAVLLAGCSGGSAAPPPRPAPAPAPAPTPAPATKPEPKCDQPASRPIVQRGSVGEDVRALQSALGLNADGVFGPNTERAVRDAQRAQDLRADGIVGERTWTALGLVCADGSTTAPRPAPAPPTQATPAPQPAPATPQTRRTDVVVTIASATRSGSTISVNGTATVPDGAYVAYEVVPARGGTAMREGAARVKDGKYSFTANVGSFPSGPVEVWVAFVTVLGGPTYDAKQPASVLELYGNMGQNITGPNVTPGLLRLVEAIRIVN
jgi:hypothetical protein